jgi:hypothetical protein
MIETDYSNYLASVIVVLKEEYWNFIIDYLHMDSFECVLKY